MAAIVRRDPYQKLARKIGYSVGLESLVDRVKMLVDLYVAEGAFPPGAFEALVTESFGRKSSAAKHFADFFGTLNLIQTVGRTVEPLYQLDSLSILRRMLDSDAMYDTAVKVVLTQCIVEADADIFLNGLIGNFQPEEMEQLLAAMVSTKVAIATRDMRTPAIVKKLQESLAIKNQSGKSASGDETMGKDRFGRRKTPLDSFRRNTSLSPKDDHESATIPADYLKKARQTRKSWAEDLGLFRSGERTARGDRLLDALSRTVVSREPSLRAALFWGYRSELDEIQAKLQLTIADAKPCDEWDMLTAIEEAWRENRAAPGRAPDADEAVQLLRYAFELYSAPGASAKAIIRNSLPLYIAEPVFTAWCVAQGRALPDVPAILVAEYERSGEKRVQRMIIRGTSGALFFMR